MRVQRVTYDEKGKAVYQPIERFQMQYRSQVNKSAHNNSEY
jgi:hypothetical protein